MLLKKIYIFILSILPLFVSGSLPHVDSSVLAKGRWYKLAVTHTGIHKITWQNLNAMGVDPSKINVDNIRLFGNGSGMLPEVNMAPRVDDLRELALKVSDGGDGHFDSTDYFLFYGESADKWNFDRLTRFYSHQRNLYSDSTFYFLNFDQHAGKRVQNEPLNPATPNYSSSVFDDFALHELDQANLIRSGREWYGETFDNQTNVRTFPCSFPDIDTITTVRIKWYVAANSPVPSFFYLSQGNIVIDSLKVDSTNPTEFTRAGVPKYKLTSIIHPPADQSIKIGRAHV